MSREGFVFETILFYLARAASVFMNAARLFERILRCAVRKNDLHILFQDGGIWHNDVQSVSEPPEPRSHFGFAETSGSAFLFGGRGGAHLSLHAFSLASFLVHHHRLVRMELLFRVRACVHTYIQVSGVK